RRAGSATARQDKKGARTTEGDKKLSTSRQKSLLLTRSDRTTAAERFFGATCLGGWWIASTRPRALRQSVRIAITGFEQVARARLRPSGRHRFGYNPAAVCPSPDV